MSLHPKMSVQGNEAPPRPATGLDEAGPGQENWFVLVEQIAQLEELIADLRRDRERHSVLTVRKLDAMLKEKRTRLKAIDIGA